MGEASMGPLFMVYNASPAQPNTTVSNFALDAYEVTVARFRRWVVAGRPIPSASVTYRGGAMPFEGTVNTDAELNCGLGANYPRTDRESHPMNCASLATA
jgi:formylglycine-generating enzyme required for sulfatase activity